MDVKGDSYNDSMRLLDCIGIDNGEACAVRQGNRQDGRVNRLRVEIVRHRDRSSSSAASSTYTHNTKAGK